MDPGEGVGCGERWGLCQTGDSHTCSPEERCLLCESQNDLRKKKERMTRSCLDEELGEGESRGFVGNQRTETKALTAEATAKEGTKVKG